MSCPADVRLPDILEAKTAALSRRCIDAMYRDPFWSARFGERGHRYALEDSAYHVKYVVAALRAEDAAVFRNYALWLRGVLASRGMCSRHLAQSFEQLTAAMNDEGLDPDGFAPAAEILAAGVAVLEYTKGDAGELAKCREAVEAHVSRTLPLETRPYRFDELWSFLLDGVDRGDSSAFPAHVSFLATSLATSPHETHALQLTLEEMRRACSEQPSLRGRSAIALLDAGLRKLAAA